MASAYSTFSIITSKVVFVIVIHAESMQRIQNHDPLVARGKTLLETVSAPIAIRNGLTVSSSEVLICYEENEEDLLQKRREFVDDGHALLKWLCRNWENRPEDAEPVRRVTIPTTDTQQ